MSAGARKANCRLLSGGRAATLPAARSPRAQRRPLLPSPLSGRSRPARAPPPGAPARPPGPDAAPAPRKWKESPERGRGREGGAGLRPHRGSKTAMAREEAGCASTTRQKMARGRSGPRRAGAGGRWGSHRRERAMRWPGSPHLHPARGSPRRFCSILGILSAPNDLHTVPAPTRR